MAKAQNSSKSLVLRGASTPLPGVEIIDLDQHPDAALLRACVRVTALRDKLGQTGGSMRTSEQDAYYSDLHLITETEALTPFGLQTKALFVMGDRSEPFEHSPCFLYASVIRDFLRMGVAS